jgi:predicted nuclease of restriction endonuclease-like RecB superfamily
LLPSNLLVVWKRKGEILPRYAKLSTDNLEAANSLIEAYTRHIGEKKKALKTLVADLENKGYEYRFVRGLALLLDRRGTFMCNSKVKPADLRKKLFQATEKVGLPTTLEKRQRILENAASEIALTLENIEEYLYADLDDELILEKFDPPSASELLEQYNLSLTQTLLFDSTELSFTASGNWQRLFHSVKKFGLIYEVYQDDDFWVKIDGPASLFKLTKRYGVSIAKLLPFIVANPEWTVRAKILWKYTNEICNFKIESRKHSSLLRKPHLQPVTYDSAAEESFASQFQAVKSGWTLKREPVPIPAGNQVIIPDFSLERAGLKVFMEIVGFWTEEYLMRKAEKLKQVEARMLLLVDEALACEKLTALEKRPQLYFIYYHDKIPLASILRYLEKAFEEVKAKEIKFLENLPVKFTEPVVAYDEFAARIGVSVEAVKTFLIINSPSGYWVMPNILVSKEKLKQINIRIEECLNQSGKLNLTKATQIIEAEGVSDASCVLTQLGYKITWRGINSEHAEVSKPQKREQL